MHFCDVTLTVRKPISEAYPKTLENVGDHLRKKRLDLKLFQKDVAKVIGVDTLTVCNWEKNRTSPRLCLLPRVFAFLGYDPFPFETSALGWQIKQYRRTHGLSIKKLAKRLGIDPSTLARWEKNVSEPLERLKPRILELLFVEN